YDSRRGTANPGFGHLHLLDLCCPITGITHHLNPCYHYSRTQVEAGVEAPWHKPELPSIIWQKPSLQNQFVVTHAELGDPDAKHKQVTNSHPSLQL
ncbi:Hypothetical predicted protein, partial [Pelobates cultripes]